MKQLLIWKFEQHLYLLLCVPALYKLEMLPLKLADVELHATMIHRSTTRKRGTTFFFNKLEWYRREKVDVEASPTFKLISAFFATCHIIFDFMNFSMQRIKEVLVVRYFMRIHPSKSSHLSKWGVTFLVVCFSFLVLYHYPSKLSILFLSE